MQHRFFIDFVCHLRFYIHQLLEIAFSLCCYFYDLLLLAGYYFKLCAILGTVPIDLLLQFLNLVVSI